ncbi:MAG TPA: hypothetical protein VFL46_07875, partial [Phycicoccus sp.]|nr:hypothetical protein [Phycicoccus sp.]
MGRPVRSRDPEATGDRRDVLGRREGAGRYLLRTVEAVVLEWAALGAGAGAVPVELRRRLEELVAAGVDVAVVAPDATAAEVQARLLAEARGAGALLLAARDGLFVVGVSGTRTLRRGSPRGGGDGLSGEVRAVLARRGTTAALTLAVTTDSGTADHSHLIGLLDEQLWRRRAGRAPDIDEDPAWVVVADTDDDVGRRVTDALFTLADGMLGTRGACAEASRVGARLVQVAGVYTGRGSAERLLPGPWWPAARVTGGPDAERRVLDLRSGLLLHERARHGPDGVARQREVRLASAASPRLLAMRLEGPAHAVALEPPSGPTPAAADPWSRAGDDAGRGVAVLVRDRTRDEGGLRTVERLATYATHADSPDDEDALRARLDRAAARGFDAALRDHRRAWARRWEAVDVEIPGDAGLQLAARLALFHLWGLATREDEAAVGARGLSGTGYRGHVFWDADVFVMPALVTLSPRSARAMLTYRLRRLPRAREAAQALGRDGARFPWESAEDGSDVTPRWIRIGRERVAVRTGEQEEHVVADVAWAADHYAAWSGDGAWLRGPGSALVVEAARYWASRCRVDGDGVAHVDGVIGPDE